ncbi:MAG: hypothetical protein KDD62_15040, partial [Bdellovibrionales bacterium]|nr:hypothetical protein [Bdellovibrionales bacterium]
MIGIDANPEQIKRVGLSFTYRIAEDPKAPLVLLVHGRGGDRNVMWSFNRSIPSNFHILAPEAPLMDPEIGGYSWWLIHDRENRDSMIAESVTRLTEFYRLVLGALALEPEVCIACGFSQGGALLSEVVNQNLIPCAGLGLLSSFVLPRVFRADLPEVFIAHGRHDEIIPLEKAYEGKDRL